MQMDGKGDLPMASRSRRLMQSKIPAAKQYLTRHGAEDLGEMIFGEDA